MKIGLVLLAGGRSSRFGGKHPKPFLQLGEQPLALHSLDVFLQIPEISEFVIVVPTDYQAIFPSCCTFATPGPRRQDSMENGVHEMSDEITHVLVHDAARPFIVKKDVEALIESGVSYKAASLASPVANTLKEVCSSKCVQKTVSRDGLWEVHTPQFAEINLLKEGLEKAHQEKLSVTDELQLIEPLGIQPKLHPSSFPNVKLTYSRDLPLFKALFSLYREQAGHHAKI